MRPALLLLVLLLLSACGMKGALYLPPPAAGPEADTAAPPGGPAGPAPPADPEDGSRQPAHGD